MYEGTTFVRSNFLAQFLVILIAISLGMGRSSGQNISPTNIELTLTRPVWHSTGQGLRFPTNFDTPNDESGRFFITGLAGRTDMFFNGAESTFLDISSEVFAGSGTGMLGLAFHPEYDNPLSPGYRKLYTYHSSLTAPSGAPTFSTPGFTTVHYNYLTEWQASSVNPNVVDLSTRRVLYSEAHPASHEHNGGGIDFGPDGYLYISTGVPPGAFQFSQSLGSVLGKVLRIDPLAPELTTGSPDLVSPNGQYRIPATNPFVSNPSALGEVFAYGFRNPYRMSVDPVSGIPFLGDVGQGTREEVDAVLPGSNYGWSYREGSMPYVGTPPAGTVFTDPIAEYTHSDGRSVTGGFMYRGSIPELQGKYIFAEFSWGSGDFNEPGRLFWIDPFDGDGNLKSLSDIKINEFRYSESTYDIFRLFSDNDDNIDIVIYSLGVDDDGEIYILGEEAQRLTVYKIVGAVNLSPPGDFNGDLDVDSDDLAEWRLEYGPQGNADADGDGDTDGRDFLMWQRNYGTSAPLGESAAIPEPGTLFLACVALGLSAASRRKTIV